MPSTYVICKITTAGAWQLTEITRELPCEIRTTRSVARALFREVQGETALRQIKVYSRPWCTCSWLTRMPWALSLYLFCSFTSWFSTFSRGFLWLDVTLRTGSWKAKPSLKRGHPLPWGLGYGPHLPVLAGYLQLSGWVLFLVVLRGSF